MFSYGPLHTDEQVLINQYYLQLFSMDTECSLVDLTEALDVRDECRVGKICDGDTTMIMMIYTCLCVCETQGKIFSGIHLV